MSAPHGPASPECRALFERLSEYLDGELDPALCAHVEGHLTDCAPCVRFLESLRRTVRWIERSEGATLPREVREELLRESRRLRDGSRGEAT